MILPLMFTFSLLGPALSADILAVFPHIGKSHFDVFEPLVLALAGRGHSLTVLSFFPQKVPVPNYSDISLLGVAPIYVEALKFDYLKGMNAIKEFIGITTLGVELCETILGSHQVRSLVNNSKTFDLIIVETFNTDCFLGLVDVFNAPYIGISSSSYLPTLYPRLGSFDSPAYFPNLFFPYTSRMSFLQRVVNTAATAWMRLARTHHFQPQERRALRRVFGLDVNVDGVAGNMSLVFVNTHYSLQGARPLPPGFVEVGGLHIPYSKPIPEELEKYLTDAPEGVLLFSMGSVLQSSSFPDDKRQAFMDAFAELPVRVLMKWENDTLPGKPDNVLLSRWLPQRDLLAHPKIRAFMGHGGLLSTSEAVYCGVPMVLIPMFGDQPNNVAHLQATGAAIRLPYNEITKVTVLQALRSVLNDPSYKEKAMTLSEQYRDRPMPPLDTAVYWTEYVIRHKGARHLRSPAVDMPWYQLWLLDVIATLFASLALTLWVLVWIVRRATHLASNLIWPDTLHHKRD